ncbi:hypothetical protein [Sphingomicrobium nitratireducens]|uniref:hypothetical protein n=1 Tax=Sphingomicrobium nitratireducens TaxID=2964666 RepID=UPI00223F4121|nr:hypothetical protein [Sphingomicrobium nitratireducens]
MNAPFAIEPPSLRNAALSDANQWRGAMVDLFARGEMLIAKALRRRQGEGKIPLHTSERAQQLAAHLGEDDAGYGALETFMALYRRRTSLIHGLSNLIVEEGGWVLAVEWDDGAGPRRDFFTEAESETDRLHLKSVVDQLRGALAS